MASPNVPNGHRAQGAGPSNGDSGRLPPQKKSQKEMTKAERREQQEKQRAAKAANVGAKLQPQKQGGVGPSKQSTNGASPSVTHAKKSAAPPDSFRPSASTAFVSKYQASKEMKESLATQDTSTQTRRLRIFEHFGGPRPQMNNKGDIHPSILQLGLKFSNYVVVGANARCIATLCALKDFIQDYTTPSDKSLSRHLMTRISPQINHLVAARPMAVTMGNAIRQLKLEISKIDLDMPEQNAKEYLYTWIDDYIREKILVADECIAVNAVEKINDGDVILTYAKSSVVEKVLRHAWEQGKRFSVVVVDSRPMLEGKELLRSLVSLEIPCTYVLLPSISSIMKTVKTILIGAHSIHSDGAVSSRAGTALVAAVAKYHHIPVLVCCEIHKYSESMQLDSFAKNEFVPQKNLLHEFPTSIANDKLALQPTSNLEFLGSMYDLTPPANITAVVTEIGILPPKAISSIPSIQDRDETSRSQ